MSAIFLDSFLLSAEFSSCHDIIRIKIPSVQACRFKSNLGFFCVQNELLSAIFLYNISQPAITFLTFMTRITFINNIRTVPHNWNLEFIS